MKLSQLVLLGVTSVFIAVAPISYAIADQAPAQIVAQSPSVAIATGASLVKLSRLASPASSLKADTAISNWMLHFALAIWGPTCMFC
jgi:hypothetical protein